MYQRKNEPRNEQQKACDKLVMTFLQVDGFGVALPMLSLRSED